MPDAPFLNVVHRLEARDKLIEVLEAEIGRLRAIVRVNLMRSCGASHAEIDELLNQDSGAPQPRGEPVQTNATQPAGSPNLCEGGFCVHGVGLPYRCVDCEDAELPPSNIGGSSNG